MRPSRPSPAQARGRLLGTKLNETGEALDANGLIITQLKRNERSRGLAVNTFYQHRLFKVTRN